MVCIMLGFQLTKMHPVVSDNIEMHNELFLLELFNSQPKIACEMMNMIEANSPVTCARVPFIKLLDNLPKKLHGHRQGHVFLVCELPACC